MVRFAIVGAGGHGRVIADIILACGGEIAFVVDDSPQGKILANKKQERRNKRSCNCFIFF